ncbi:GRB2-associated-binding protein 1-like isoform X1 [Thalassophryne amazonica]|uniref:GRB2-associated-binding protein 1-like isoform X1 n=1 Tax=Thalassophryne amazonica TaxID=390379 RepID=UPI0014719B42|nr:GRB2-associated-binding protein 1-like isoform X1 [Thalassophryne amazonica]
MSGSGDVVCEGWLRKSPPEKKLRRYAWRRRWFVLRSGRLSGEPDILAYYKNQQSRRPIRTINLNLCEQVDAGLSFTKKELESSFVFALQTKTRTWYLVSESEDDMNHWVSSICLLCGFSPTDDGTEGRVPITSSHLTVTSTSATVTTETGSVLPPYEPVNVQHLEFDGSSEEDYLWLSHCQSRIRSPPGSSTSLEIDSDVCPTLSTTSSLSSASSSPSLIPNGVPPPSTSSCFRNAPWTVATTTSPLSRSLDTTTWDIQKHSSRPRCYPSPHPKKHTLSDLHPVAIPLTNDPQSSTYQIPRAAFTRLPGPSHLPSSTPSVDSLTHAELHASTPAPPLRPPKPQVIVGQGQSSESEPRTHSQSTSESERLEGWMEGGDCGPSRMNAVDAPGYMHTSCDSLHVPQSLSDRASMFEFSASFSSYFFNKGMVPLGSVCCQDEDLDKNYVPMSAATTEPPVAPRVGPPPPAVASDASVQMQDAYVPMTPLTVSKAHPTSTTGELLSLGRQVPPPAHMGFRNSPLTAVAPVTAPVQRNHTNTSTGMGVEATPPPVHRNLKPQRQGACVGQNVEKSNFHTSGESTHKPKGTRALKVRPAPLNITPVQEDWNEVPPPVRSPVTRTFTRHPSSRQSVKAGSSHSSSPSSDSDDPDDNYVAMTTSNLSFSAGESSLRILLHRASEGGVSSPLPRRPKSEKQVEYLDLDLHTKRSTPPRQKCCTTEGGVNSNKQLGANEEHTHARVDYVVVDPKKTKALRNTREAWHDGRMSTEKGKC